MCEDFVCNFNKNLYILKYPNYKIEKQCIYSWGLGVRKYIQITRLDLSSKFLALTVVAVRVHEVNCVQKPFSTNQVSQSDQYKIAEGKNGDNKIPNIPFPPSPPLLLPRDHRQLHLKKPWPPRKPDVPRPSLPPLQSCLPSCQCFFFFLIFRFSADFSVYMYVLAFELLTFFV